MRTPLFVLVYLGVTTLLESTRPVANLIIGQVDTHQIDLRISCRVFLSYVALYLTPGLNELSHVQYKLG